MSKVPGTFTGEGGGGEQEIRFVPRERSEYVPMGQIVEFDEGGFAKLTFIINPLKAVTIVLAADNLDLLIKDVQEKRPSASGIVTPKLVVPS